MNQRRATKLSNAETTCCCLFLFRESFIALECYSYQTNQRCWCFLRFRTLTQHRWFSGRMLACHAGGPGSIPGRCKSQRGDVPFSLFILAGRKKEGVGSFQRKNVAALPMLGGHSWFKERSRSHAAEKPVNERSFGTTSTTRTPSIVNYLLNKVLFSF
jgi:hypothetical protein